MSVPVVLAFAAGVVSFLSPCIVPMISVYLTLITGMTLEELKAAPGLWARRSIMVNTLLFVLGFALVFTAAGGAAGAVGSLFEQARRPLEIVGGVLIVMLGLSMTGLLRLRLPGRLHIPANLMRHRPRGPLGSFAVGLFFAVACSHCIAPTLLSVMAVAGTTGSPSNGALTMLIFSLGLALPYLATAAAIGPVLERLARWKVGMGWVRPGTGIVLVGFGLLMIGGQLTRLTELSSRLLPFKAPLGM